jgi:hypothetical protein
LEARLSDAIEFDAIVYKVQTLAEDHGLRFTFDAPETAIIAAAQLMATKREGIALHITVTTEKQSASTRNENGVQKRRERKSIRSPA